MGELKPLGSEKLQGDAKMKRILELTYYQSSGNSKKQDTIVEQTSSGVYGIVKEKDGYYVKRGLTEGSLDYIGGLFMKNKNRFSSYAEALKKMEFLVEQEKLQEATKYVLKSKTPKTETPIPEPTNDLPPAAPEMAPDSGEELPGTDEDLPTDDLGGETPEPEEEYLKVIQKYTGKLQEKLQDYQEKLKSEDIKYVLNMVISAVDLDNLEDVDKEEILDKFEPEEEALPDDESSDEELPSEPASDEEDLGEEDGIEKLEELIGTNFFDDEDGGDFYDEDEVDDIPEFGPEDDQAAEIASRDMEQEFDNEEEDKDREAFDDIWRKMKSGDSEEETDEQSGEPTDKEDFPIDDQLPLPDDEETATAPIPDEEETGVKELDIDELTNMVNTTVKDTLSNYFNQ